MTVAGVLAIAALAYFYSYVRTYWQYPLDDAFIHFRIARNFVEAGRPYFNLDQAVAGSSSPFWTLLISLMFVVFGTNLLAVAAVTFAFTVVVFTLLVRLLSYRWSALASVCAAFFIVAVFLLNVSAELMETPFALTCFLAALVCWHHRWFGWLGFFSAMAFVTRYEFALWLLVGFALSDGFSAKRRFLTGAALPVLSLLLFDQHYFAVIIPNTVIAKGRVYHVAWAEFFSTSLLMHRPELVALLLASGLLVHHALRNGVPPWERANALFPLLLLMLYWLTRTLLFEWYLPIILVPLAVSSVLLPAPRRRLCVAVLLLTALRPFPMRSVLEAYGLLVGNDTMYRDYLPGARVRQYTRIGADLWHLFPTATLMTSEIGGLGWAFRGKVIDAAGLVSPECLTYHPMKVPEERANGTVGAIPPQAVRDLQPMLVVSMETFSEAFRRDLASGRMPGYRLFKTYPVINEADSARSGIGELWNAQFTQVYVRQ